MKPVRAEQFATMKGCHLPRVQKSCMCIYRSAEAMRTYVGAHYLFINCCFSLSLSLLVFRFLFDLTYIFQLTSCEWESVRFCVPAQHRRISSVYTASEWAYVSVHGHTVTEREISIRKKKKLACAHVASTRKHTQTNIRLHSNQRWRSLILLQLYEKQIKHAYRSTMRLEWVTNNNNKWNQRRCDWIKSYHLLCTLYTTHCKVYLVVDFFVVLSPSPHATVWIYE